MNTITELVALIKPMLSKKDVAKVQTDIQSMGKGFESAFSSWGTAVSHMITRVLGPLALLHKAFQFGESIVHAALLGNELSNMSNIVNVGVENLQGLTAAAANVNVSTQQVEIGLRRLSFVMNKANEGAKGFADILPGRWWEDGNGKVLTATDMFMKLSDIMNKMPNDIHKTAKMHVLLGRTGERLEPLMNKGSAAIQNYIQTLKEYGLAIDKNGVAKSVKLNEQLQDLSLRWEGFKQTIAQSGFIEMLGSMLTKIGWLVLGLTRALQGNSDGWDAAALASTSFFTAALAGTGLLIWKLKVLQVEGLKALAPWLPIIALFVAAGIALQDLWVFSKGGKSVFGDFASYLSNTWAGKVLTSIGAIFYSVERLLNLIAHPLTLDSWTSFAKGVLTIISQMYAGIRQGVKALIASIFSSIPFIGGAIAKRIAVTDSESKQRPQGTAAGRIAVTDSESKQRPQGTAAGRIAVTDSESKQRPQGTAAGRLASSAWNGFTGMVGSMTGQISVPSSANATPAPMTANITINPSAGMDEKAVGEQVRKELETFDRNQRQSTYSGLHSGGAF